MHQCPPTTRGGDPRQSLVCQSIHQCSWVCCSSLPYPCASTWRQSCGRHAVLGPIHRVLDLVFWENHSLLRNPIAHVDQSPYECRTNAAGPRSLQRSGGFDRAHHTAVQDVGQRCFVDPLSSKSIPLSWRLTWIQAAQKPATRDQTPSGRLPPKSVPITTSRRDWSLKLGLRHWAHEDLRSCEWHANSTRLIGARQGLTRDHASSDGHNIWMRLPYGRATVGTRVDAATPGR